MKVVNLLIKPSSSMCNMRCDYCFYYDETIHRTNPSFGFMREKTLENIIKKSIDFAEEEIYIAFQGGEPTLRGLEFFQKVIELEKKYNTKNLKIHNSLQTNGFSINEDWCKFFAENDFLIGLSIDGTRQTHNKHRHTIDGNDTYQNMFYTAQLFEKYHVEYNILTVVNAITAPEIKQIYHEYKKRNWKYQQYIACLDPIGEKKRSYSLTPEIYGKFLIDLFHLWYKDLQKNKQPYIRQFENWVGILLGYPPEACEQRGICGIQYVVEADGSVYPCDFYMLDEYKLGNFNTDDYSIFDERRNIIEFIERSRNTSETCKKCKYYFMCRNGCQRCRTLKEDQYQNIFCESYKMFFEECLGDLEYIASVIIQSSKK